MENIKLRDYERINQETAGGLVRSETWNNNFNKVEDVVRENNEILKQNFDNIKAQNIPSPALEELQQTEDSNIYEQIKIIVNELIKKANKTDVDINTSNLIKQIDFDELTGIFTFTRLNGNTFTIDTIIEKIPIKAELISKDGVPYLKLTNEDGSYTESIVADLIRQIEFIESDTIGIKEHVSDETTEEYKFGIKEGSIEEKYLAAEFVGKFNNGIDAAVNAATSANNSAETAKEYANTAREQSISASNYASEANNSQTEAYNDSLKSKSYAVGGTGVRINEDNDNSKYYSEQSKLYAETSLKHESNKENPHEVNASQIGLGNVDNTADLDKPISKEMKEALDNKTNKTDFEIDNGKVKSITIGNNVYKFSGAILPEIVVTAPINTEITLTKNALSTTQTIIEESVSFKVEEFGEYTITAINGNDTVIKTIDVKSASRYDVTIRFFKVYGLHVNTCESNPDSAITYLEDAVGKTPAKMNYETGIFDYGDWEDTFFMPKPCMLKYDGTVDYYLDKNDYTKKETGENSDVANTNYEGNAMMEFPKIWTKYEAVSGGYNIYIAEKQVDETYNAYSFINASGEYIDHCYMPIYNGSLINSKLRSISGQTPIYSNTAEQEISYAQANNPGTDKMWNIEVLADILLVNSLLMLIGRSLNTQTTFGNGYHTGGSESSNPRIETGTMNTKGLFWGKNTSDMTGVKVFGMEHWWGNQWRRYAGHINANGMQKIKLTYGKQDGSTVDGYNNDGSGYIDVEATPSGTSGGYISSVKANEYGVFPQNASGSSSTFYCDGLYFKSSQTFFAYRGGTCNSNLRAGAFYCNLSHEYYDTNWYLGAAISCKPI